MKAQSHIMVKKFGGTSLGSIERILWVAERLVNDSMSGQKPVVVASAMAGDTDRLVGLARSIDPAFRGPSYDVLLSAGEQIAIALLSMAIEKKGGRAKAYLAHQLKVHTNSMFSRARLTGIDTVSIHNDLREGIIPVIAGFQGVDSEGNITTLGRGGSDTSAVAVAAALKLSDCEIYTDVPAVYSADPRLVSRAREIHILSYEDMLEMASVGSKVLHPRSVLLGAKHGVRIHLRSTFELRDGTWIVPGEEVMENPTVSAVTQEANTAVLKIFGLSGGLEKTASLFEAIAEKGIVVDLILPIEEDGEKGLAISVPEDEREVTLALVKSVYPAVRVTTMEKVSKVSIVGVGMRNQPGVAARFFRIMNDTEIPLHYVTTSEIRVSAIIDKAHLSSAAQALHKGFLVEG